jgi:hypothetical protein
MSDVDRIQDPDNQSVLQVLIQLEESFEIVFTYRRPTVFGLLFRRLFL